MDSISPFLIPLAGILVAIVSIVCGAITQMHNSRLKADQRMALLARGLSPAEIEAFFASAPGEERAPKDPLRSLGNARRAGTVLISVGIGLSLFFLIMGAMTLTHIDPNAGWSLLGCTGIGLIPLAIGIGFLIDYRMQLSEMARFGLELDTQSTRQ